MSLPTRERGLKQPDRSIKMSKAWVAPHAGAWIETADSQNTGRGIYVAPHAGAWIETIVLHEIPTVAFVAPHAGAWIETQRL